MAYSRFQIGVLFRVIGLVATLAGLAWLVAKSDWYVTILLVPPAAGLPAILLSRFATESGREVARFLEAVAFGDNSASFSSLSHDSAFAELGAAMARVLD